MNRQAVALGRILQHVFEEQAIFVIGEDGFAIIAPQNDVLRDAFDEITG
ncbi:MAG TPA: hypothetical protein VF472_00205 [Burkholderiaceae bacterium]